MDYVVCVLTLSSVLRTYLFYLSQSVLEQKVKVLLEVKVEVMLYETSSCNRMWKWNENRIGKWKERKITKRKLMLWSGTVESRRVELCRDNCWQWFHDRTNEANWVQAAIQRSFPHHISTMDGTAMVSARINLSFPHQHLLLLFFLSVYL